MAMEYARVLPLPAGGRSPERLALLSGALLSGALLSGALLSGADTERLALIRR
jgi:uncharacterized protein YjbI with pentapeptide repeats